MLMLLLVIAQVDTGHVGIAYAKGTLDFLVRVDSLDMPGGIVTAEEGRQVVERRRWGGALKRGRMVERWRLAVGLWSIRMQMRIRGIGEDRRGRCGELASTLLGKHGSSFIGIRRRLQGRAVVVGVVAVAAAAAVDILASTGTGTVAGGGPRADAAVGTGLGASPATSPGLGEFRFIFVRRG